jgi:hypothetical protein
MPEYGNIGNHAKTESCKQLFYAEKPIGADAPRLQEHSRRKAATRSIAERRVSLYPSR